MITIDNLLQGAKGTLGIILIQVMDSTNADKNFTIEEWKLVLQAVIAVATVISLFWKKRKKD